MVDGGKPGVTSVHLARNVLNFQSIARIPSRAQFRVLNNLMNRPNLLETTI